MGQLSRKLHKADFKKRCEFYPNKACHNAGVIGFIVDMKAKCFNLRKEHRGIINGLTKRRNFINFKIPIFKVIVSNQKCS